MFDVLSIDIDSNILEESLSEQCLSIVNKYKDETDRRNSLVAWYLLDKYLKKDFYIDLKSKVIKFNEYNKPYISDIYFNISHSYNYVAIIISKDSCGIDIEYVDNKKMYKDYFIKSILSKSEYEAYQKNPTNDFIIERWTMKEAYFKRCNTGIIKSRLNEEIDYEAKSYPLYDKAGNKYYLSISPKDLKVKKCQV